MKKYMLIIGILVVIGVSTYFAINTKSSKFGNAAGDIAQGVGDVVSTVGKTATKSAEGIGITTPEPRVKTKNVNETCSSNDECINGACGRIDAGSGALVCCPSGATATYAGFDYCKEIKTGDACWSDYMCASGYCKGNAGGVQKGICTKKGETGDACETNSDCRRNACVRANAADNAPLTCCASGEYTTYAGYDYCTKMPKGSVCWSDAMCSSGNCSGNMSGMKKGKCS